MPFAGVCPYWEGESRDKTRMHCAMAEIKFSSKEQRRKLCYKYCGNEYKKCALYKVQSEEQS